MRLINLFEKNVFVKGENNLYNILLNNVAIDLNMIYNY